VLVDRLWDALLAFNPHSRDVMFAHCVALGVNAVMKLSLLLHEADIFG
jgi:hypothetical protein